MTLAAYETNVERQDVVRRPAGETGAALGSEVARLLDSLDQAEKQKAAIFAEAGIPPGSPSAEFMRVVAKNAVEFLEGRRPDMEYDRLVQYAILDSQASVMCPACRLWDSGHDAEAGQRRKLSIAMTGELFLAQFRAWIREMRAIASDDPETGAGSLANAMEMWLYTLQHQGVTSALADGLCRLLASRSQILDLLKQQPGLPVSGDSRHLCRDTGGCPACGTGELASAALC